MFASSLVDALDGYEYANLLRLDAQGNRIGSDTGGDNGDNELGARVLPAIRGCDRGRGRDTTSAGTDSSIGRCCSSKSAEQAKVKDNGV